MKTPAAPPLPLLRSAASLLAVTSLGLAAAVPDDDDLAPSDADVAFYRERVRPILEASCLDCHGAGRRLRAELDMTTRAGLLHGGSRGPAYDADAPGESLLLAMTSYRDEQHQMPPSGKLSDEELEVLATWIERGAPYDPADEPEGGHGEEAEPMVPLDGMEGWAYRTLVSPPPPPVADESWVRNPIDRFVLAELEAVGLAPAPEADRRTLARRLYFDLTGLPPTAEEVERFVADTSPGAYERLVDALLASPRYGERWGRHWLDCVRYAETNGFERDSDKPFMWRYRDYVIDAFNQDLPYDRFVLEQLAGDELPDATSASIVATGFTRLMQWDDEPGQGVVQARYDVLDDLVRVTGETFLGMTIGCARCHDHKGDPITQEDYYSFMAFFQGLTDQRAEGTLVDIASPAERAEAIRVRNERQAAIERARTRTRAIEELVRRRLIAQRASDGVEGPFADLSYRLYEGRWSALPDFDALEPISSGALPAGFVGLDGRRGDQHFGYVFEGFLEVERAGAHRFELDSDDGARLTVAGDVVLEYDGIHGLGAPRSADVDLPAGRVPVRLDYFQGAGGLGLHLHVERDPHPTWSYTFDEPAGDWIAEGFDASSWETGAPGFGSRGTAGAEVRTVWDTPDIWLRNKFVWTEDAGTDFVFAGQHDDGVEVYLNGVLVLTRAGYLNRYQVLEPDVDDLAPLLHTGLNTLAVHCAQDVGGRAVHLALVPRAEVEDARPVDLAFGRRPLTAHGASAVPPNLPEYIDQQGEQLLTGAELAEWREARGELRRAQGIPIPSVMANAALENGPTPPPMFVHLRGNAHVHGDPVEPAYPSCLEPPAVAIPAVEGGRTSGRRLALARWIASDDNPLTPRVLANRLWQHHFGRGICPTTSDFGNLGQRPTHPALLDWLAADLVAGDWRVKRMHRRIVTSSAYRMSSRASDEALELDVTNRLFSRFEMRRLSAEELRDSILATTGELRFEMGGPGFYSRMPAAALATSSRPNDVWGKSPDAVRNRRSVYIKVKRSLVTPLLANFDFADTDNPCPERFTTTLPTQALNLLNGEFVQERASAFADRIAREAGGDPASRIELAHRLCLSRSATADEVDDYVAFQAELERDFGLTPRQALAQTCVVLFNLNEFVYLD